MTELVKGIAPTGTTRTRLRDLREVQYNGEGMQVLAVQGMARSHQLWTMYEVDATSHWTTLVYVVVPDGGPIKYIRAWHADHHDFPSWTTESVDFTTQEGVTEWVVEQAMAEVRREYGA